MKTENLGKMKLDEFIKEIESYKELGDNWDSYRAKAIDESRCNIAISVVRLIHKYLSLETYKNEIEVVVCPCSEGIAIQIKVMNKGV